MAISMAIRSLVILFIVVLLMVIFRPNRTEEGFTDPGKFITDKAKFIWKRIKGCTSSIGNDIDKMVPPDTWITPYYKKAKSHISDAID